MTPIRATHRPRSGFQDYEIPPSEVTILSFVEATIAPGYRSSGTKRCIVAIIVGDDGRLDTAELPHLTIKE